MASAAQGLAQSFPDLRVLNPNRLLTRADGSPNPDYYLSDGINLNNEGYARITLLLEQAVEAARIPVLEDTDEGMTRIN
jgi:lysophospholipase L1-like esterase